MSKFKYKAKKGPGKVVQDIIEASNRKEAIDKLTQQGVTPVKIKEAGEGEIEKTESEESGEKEKATRSPLRLFKKVKSRDLTVMTSQLASLIKSKVSLLEAITILQDQTEAPYLKKVFSHIQGELRDGKTLSEALSHYPDVFSSLYINMIKAGESGGVLEDSLIRLAKLRTEEEEMKSKITSALAYPAFIIVVGIITIFLLLTFVLPKLTSLFSNMQQTLPLPTRFLMGISEYLKHYWIILVVIVGVSIFAWKKLSSKKKDAIDRFKLKIPMLGSILKKRELARLSRTLRVLLNSGIPVFKALKISTLTVNNEVIKTELQNVRKDVVDGSRLGRSLKKYDLFPRFMSDMVSVGEKGGNLADTLLEVDNIYQQDIDRAIKVITSLLEPMIILMMGLVIGFIVFAMMLPIFQLNMSM